MSRSLLQKLRPYYVRKAFRYLRHYGPKDFLIRVRERLSPEEVPYGPWYEKHRSSEEDLARMAEVFGTEYERGADEPLFSIIVPAWRTPAEYLKQLLACVRAQVFADYELCLANASPDDPQMSRILEEAAAQDERVRVLSLKENGGIAANTNAAIAASRGTFVCFMDHDDLIAPDALYEAWQLIRSGKVDLIYTDEDKIRDAGDGELEHFQPHFKPDFNPDLLRSNAA